jgi:hypothetical protein
VVLNSELEEFIEMDRGLLQSVGTKMINNPRSVRQASQSRFESVTSQTSKSGANRQTVAFGPDVGLLKFGAWSIIRLTLRPPLHTAKKPPISIAYETKLF